MEGFGATPLSGAILPGQATLVESLWSNVPSLDSSSNVTNGLTAIRSTASNSPSSNSNLSSASSFQLDQTSDTAKVARSSIETSEAVSNPNLFSQPVIAKLTGSSGHEARAARDSLSGMAENAPLVAGLAPLQDIRINFQPDTAPVPTGYIKDIGEAYSETRGFGWVRQDSLSRATHTPLDIGPNARDRAQAGIDPRLNTLLHMQYPTQISNSAAVKTPAAWEYALPNGTYNVTVSVGDSRYYNSRHKINVEGVTAIQPFKANPIQKYELGTVSVDVTDGRLTVDAIGGTNTKINYIEIQSIAPGKHPSILSSLPTGRQEISLNAGVSLKIAMVDGAGGVDAATLTSETVQLYRTNDNTLIPGNINTTAANDAIVYQPSSLLETSTNYTFRLSNDVKDTSGNPFLPFSTTFSTGTTSIPKTPEVSFLQSAVYSGASTTSLIISPDSSKLYAASLDGTLRRWTIDPSSGNLTNLETFRGFATNPARPRALIGLAFDPTNANVLWVSNNETVYQELANDFTGRISKVRLNPDNFSASTYQDYMVGLPRSTKDHLSNSLAFGPDGKLYLTQGSNSSTGAPDAYWNYRPERLLSAAVLQIDTQQTPPQPFNVQTENYTYSTPSQTGDGLQAVYYDDLDFTGAAVTQMNPTVNFEWGQGPPAPGIEVDTFSARWAGQVAAQHSEDYTFYTQSDDGVRLWVNDQLLIDNWTDHSLTENSGTIALQAGQKYNIKMEYYENGVDATAKLLWSSPSISKGVIPQAQLYTGSNDRTITTTGNYDPYDPNAPVKIFATGIRNAYDLVWHSNGLLYVPTNGSQAGGNTPNNPETPANERLTKATGQRDYLFQVTQGSYYGHPNPKRGEYILNGGNPTSEVDLAEVVAQDLYNGYPVGIQPHPNYRGFAWNFGYNRSPNGVIEYQSDTFNGALKNQLLVVEYSAGDDILALKLDDSGSVSGTGVTQLALGFKNPVDVIEDTRTGSLYVSELVKGTAGQGQISLLRPA